MDVMAPTHVSAALRDLVGTAELVVARTNFTATYAGHLERLRARIEHEAKSPRSVGLIDEKTIALLDVLDWIEAKRRVDDARAVKLWRQIAGVLIPEVQDDLMAALAAERGR